MMIIQCIQPALAVLQPLDNNMFYCNDKLSTQLLIKVTFKQIIFIINKQIEYKKSILNLFSIFALVTLLLSQLVKLVLQDEQPKPFELNDLQFQKRFQELSLLKMLIIFISSARPYYLLLSPPPDTSTLDTSDTQLKLFNEKLPF